MSAKKFVDTNILIYAYDLDAGAKHHTCQKLVLDLWENGGGVISTQVMQEFYVNVTKKIPSPLTPRAARELLADYDAWQVEVATPSLIYFASEIQERNTLSFWDALIIATACQAEVDVLLSEDLNAGQIIEGVEIVNPLAG